jgi:integrase
MGTVRFNLREDKKISSGLAPIDIVYQLHGNRAYFRTKFKILSHFWDPKLQRALTLAKKELKSISNELPIHLIPQQSEIEELNVGLSNYRVLIKQIESRFEEESFCYTSRDVINRLKEKRGAKTKKIPPANLLFNFIDQYIVEHSGTRKPGSLTVYKSLKYHLKAYQNEKKASIRFQDIDYQFFVSFERFLIEKRNLSNTTVAKVLSTTRTFLGYAQNNGIEISDNHRRFKIKKEILSVIALTQDEFEKLFYLDLSEHKKFEKVRDIFCLACTTGLRYSDLAQLKREHIKQDKIQITVQKTKEPLEIPLTPFSKIILERYQNNYKALPKISNQKMNDYLKGWTRYDKKGTTIKERGLCEIAGINEATEIIRFKGGVRETLVKPKYELIGVHTGRKTFVTLSLEKGMTAEEVMAISGHKDYKSFKRYVNITEQRKKAAMLRAWQPNKTETEIVL